VLAARRTPLPRGSMLWGLVALGGVFYVGQSFTYFSALSITKAGLASLLLYLYPGIVAILAFFFLGERMNPVKIGALALAATGAILTIGPLGEAKPLGVMYGVMSALFYSVYIIAGTRLMRGVDALAASTIVMAAAAVVYIPIASLQGWQLPGTTNSWIGVVGLAVVSTIAITTFLAGLELIGPVNASTLSALEPVVTAVLAALLLAEALSGRQIAGGVLILAATLILVRYGEQKRKVGKPDIP
ncbi:MAG TPA: DMT family transporter, partial [Fimbriimonadaceae bacterium]|nr:DMT family transporter [Fimbriimonadaceae bacterium]